MHVSILVSTAKVVQPKTLLPCHIFKGIMLETNTILKTKSNFTLLVYNIPFLVIGED